MVEVSDTINHMEPEINIIGRGAYLREDITIGDVIVDSVAKPYYANSLSSKQNRAHSPAPHIKIRIAASLFIVAISSFVVFLCERALPFGCMAQPMSWGGVLRQIDGEFTLPQSSIVNNLVTEIQTPVVASALVYAIVKTLQYNCALRLALICAICAWIGCCANAIVWSPSFLNCVDKFVAGSHVQPSPKRLGPGTVLQMLCSGSFAMFAVRRLLLLGKVVFVFPGYEKFVKGVFALFALCSLIAVGIGETFGRIISGTLYFVAGTFGLCIVALSVALFSKVFRTLQPVELSGVDSTLDKKTNAMKKLKWEMSCICLTLLTSSAALYTTGAYYCITSSLRRYKYVAYSVDTMVNAWCFTCLVQRSEVRLVGFNQVRNDIQ